MIRHAAESGGSIWSRTNELSDGLASRDIFTYALALCEADTDLDRLPVLFATAERMQDRDENSRGYGNFRWRWADGSVQDFNAVEFCMQAGAIIWLKHQGKLTPDLRDTVRELLEFSVEGCTRHRVPESYTNIALMNAQNLILLGEVLGKPAVADEGYARLDRVYLYTYEFGVHEYCSPTYYGTDLDCLVLIEAFCERDQGKQQARALLDLFWTDIAANWFEPARKLAGARSRDYDYLRGLGYLDVQLVACGWLDGEMGGLSAIYPALAEWTPPDHLRGLNAKYPRLVRQRWGIGVSQTRTHYLLPDVTLSSSAATYGAMDIPLTVTFPGDRKSVRGYFIADGRRDPYGKKKIAAGPHQKTLHLRPFFTSAQSTVDALSLVVYRDRDLPETAGTLESHFVLPAAVDGIWVDGEPVVFAPDTPVAIAVANSVIIRKGTAALGLRVPWARALNGEAAPVALVWDGNEYGATRLTVAHHDLWGVDAPSNNVGAASWLRVGSGIDTDADLADWRAEFASAAMEADVDDENIRIQIPGSDGPVVVAAASPFSGPIELLPTPSRAVLEIDGQAVGREILGDVEPAKSYVAQRAATPGDLPEIGEGLYLEAEDSVVMAPMVAEDDADASGGKFVWMPGESGEKGGGEGSATWLIHIAREGTYYMWGRVMAATPDDDSFFIRVFSDSAEPINMADWHIGTHETWEWIPVTLSKTVDPTPLVLPAGQVNLQLRVREDGAKLGRLFITPDPLAVP